MPADDEALARDAARATSPSAGSDRKARAEEKLFENKVKLRTVLHDLTIGGLRVLFFVAVILLLVRVYDLIAPKTYIWMSDEQVQSLDNIVFSGFIGAILGKGFNRIIPDRDEDEF